MEIISKAAPQGQVHSMNQKSLKLTPPFISVLNNETVDETHHLSIDVSGSGKCRQLPFPGSVGLLVNIQHHQFAQGKGTHYCFKLAQIQGNWKNSILSA